VGRTGERVGGRFWAASLAGAGVVIVYAVTEGAGSVRGADALLLVALVVGAAGYAEGGRLARQMPGWRVIAWGLLLALPVCLPLTGLALAVRPVHASAGSISGLAYVSAISMFLGFFAWFRGLGAAGVARASQLQLLQPFLTVAWSALLLGERPGPATLGAALLVLVCVAASQRSRFTAVATATPAAEAVAVAAVR